MNYEELRELTKNYIGLSDQQIATFKHYCALLKEWNEKFNLTAITEEEEIVEKHFYDCLLALKHIKQESLEVCDLGSGAGFPGLVFAIARPQWRITLVDSTKKKTVFLEEAAKAMGLKNVKVMNKRGEALPFREKFDLVTARAVAPLYLLLELGMPILKVNGRFLALKGSKAGEELDEAKEALRKLNCSVSFINEEELPNDAGKRNIIIITKDKPTNKKYPRTWGEMQKYHL